MQNIVLELASLIQRNANVMSKLRIWIYIVCSLQHMIQDFENSSEIYFWFLTNALFNFKLYWIGKYSACVYCYWVSYIQVLNPLKKPQPLFFRNNRQLKRLRKSFLLVIISFFLASVFTVNGVFRIIFALQVKQFFSKLTQT